MYIIMSTKSLRVVRVWSYLTTSPAATAFLRRVQAELQVHYPDDELTVLCSPAQNDAKG